MLTEDKIIEIFCMADDFCKNFSQEIKKHQLQPNDGNKTLQTLTQKLFGKLFGDKGYISSSLFVHLNKT